MHSFVALFVMGGYNEYMIEEQYLKDKRNELIWALSLQDYSNVQIARIFNINRSTIMRIVEKRPYRWKTKWIKS